MSQLLDVIQNGLSLIGLLALMTLACWGVLMLFMRPEGLRRRALPNGTAADRVDSDLCQRIHARAVAEDERRRGVKA